MGTITINRVNRIRKLKSILVISVFSFFLLSCGGGSVYNQYLSIENKHWGKEKAYSFTFEIEDNTIPYDLTLDIRNNNLYPYQNLWIFWQETLPAGSISRDTLECILADDYGKWLGKGISLFDSNFPLRTHYFFPETGTYTLSIRQGMRTDKLPGIQKIGLRVEKEKQ